ncbi:MAG: alpha/beta fold hydrolase [Granulosicoccus sp.]
MSALNVRRSGHGPVLVILHGLFGSLDNFQSISLHFDRHLSVLRIDLPAHGQSPSLPELDLASMAIAVREQLATEGIEQCHLLGHSLGGKVAMALAGDPGTLQIDSLTIVDIAPRLYPPEQQPVIDAMLALPLTSLKDRREADAQLRSSITDAGIRAFLLKSLYRQEAGPESGQFAWRFDLPAIARDYHLLCAAPDIKTTIEPPTLFIKGGRSDYILPDDEPRIREICQSPSMHIIGGTGHWPHADKPAEFTRSCLEFLNKVGRKA